MGGDNEEVRESQKGTQATATKPDVDVVALLKDDRPSTLTAGSESPWVGNNQFEIKPLSVGDGAPMRTQVVKDGSPAFLDFAGDASAEARREKIGPAFTRDMEKMRVRREDGSIEETNVPVRRYEGPGGAKVTVPEEYAKQLDELRELRKAVEEGRGVGEMTPEQAKKMLDGHPLKDRALPEDVLKAAKDLPDPRLIQIVLRGDGDPDRPGSDNPGTQNGGIVDLFKITRDQLKTVLPHEWSHAFEEWLNKEGNFFPPAFEIEKGGHHERPDTTRHNEGENFAVHLGEVLLSGDPQKFIEFVKEAPLRAAALAIHLGELMERTDGEQPPSEFRNMIGERLKYIGEHAIPEADRQLRKEMKDFNDALAGGWEPLTAYMKQRLGLPEDAGVEYIEKAIHQFVNFAGTVMQRGQKPDEQERERMS